MKQDFLSNFKEGECFKLFSDSPLYWRVIEFSPAVYSNSLRAICVNSFCNITSPFSYDTLVYRYEA